MGHGIASRRNEIDRAEFHNAYKRGLAYDGVSSRIMSIYDIGGAEITPHEYGDGQMWSLTTWLDQPGARRSQTEESTHVFYRSMEEAEQAARDTLKARYRPWGYKKYIEKLRNKP